MTQKKAGITKRPDQKPDTAKALEGFISAAPDAKPAETARKGVVRGKREQISHTMVPALLERLDARAEATGMTRASLINLAIAEYLEKENA